MDAKELLLERIAEHVGDYVWLPKCTGSFLTPTHGPTRRLFSVLLDAPDIKEALIQYAQELERDDG